MLDVSYGTKVDVWAVGCLVSLSRVLCWYLCTITINCELSRCQVFELLTGESLFDPKSFNGGDDTGTGNRKLDDAHLAQMMDLWGEQLSAAFLDKSAIRSQFFNEHGTSISPRPSLDKYRLCSQC